MRTPACQSRIAPVVSSALVGLAVTVACVRDARAQAPRSYVGEREVQWQPIASVEPAAPPPAAAAGTPAPAPVATTKPAPEPAAPVTPDDAQALASGGISEAPGGSMSLTTQTFRGKTPRFLMPLTLRGRSLALGGYLQPGFVHQGNTDFYPDDGDGFDFANMRITGHGEHTAKGELAFSFDFNFDVNAGNFGVRDAFGSVIWRRGLFRFDIGQLKQPSSLSLQQQQWGLSFAFSPETRRIALGRDQGFRLSTAARIRDVAWLSAAFMMANGEGGFRQFRNLDEKFNYSGRIEVGGLGPVDLDDPDLSYSRLGFVFGGFVGYMGGVGNQFGADDVGATEIRAGGDFRLKFRGLSVRAEYLHARRSKNGPSPVTGRYATAAQVGYMLPIPIAIPRFELVFRFQQYDQNTVLVGTEGREYIADNTARRIYEPGLVTYLYGHHAKMMLSYALTDLVEGPRTDTNGAPLIGDQLFIFFQFAWI